MHVQRLRLSGLKSFIIGGGAALALLAAGPASAEAWKLAVLPGDMALGNPRARVTVVEYASAACPHCANFNNNIFPVFKAKYIDSGKVRYVLREFLTPPNEVAAAGFLLARCAGKGRYFSTLDAFFHGQEAMFRAGDARKLIFSVGAKAGLSPAQIQACITDEAAIAELNARVDRNGMADMVTYTPTFVINGRNLPQGGHETKLADIDAMIAPLLAADGRN